MIADHLPALQVVLPLASAPLCVSLRSRRGAYAIAAGAVGFAFVTALILLSRER